MTDEQVVALRAKRIPDLTAAVLAYYQAHPEDQAGAVVLAYAAMTPAEQAAHDAAAAEAYRRAISHDRDARAQR